MPIESLFVLIIVGAVAGWLAGLIVKGFGFGLIGNIVIGILGRSSPPGSFPASASRSAAASSRPSSAPRSGR